MKLYTILILVLLITASNLMASIGIFELQDSLPKKDTSKNFFIALPIMFYGEETNWGLGITSGYYFNNKSFKKASNIQGTLIYTLKDQ